MCSMYEGLFAFMEQKLLLPEETPRRTSLDVLQESYATDYLVKSKSGAQVIIGDRVWWDESLFKAHLEPDLVRNRNYSDSLGMYRFGTIDDDYVGWIVNAYPNQKVLYIQWPVYKIVPFDRDDSSNWEIMHDLTQARFNFTGSVFFARLSPFQRRKIYYVDRFMSLDRVDPNSHVGSEIQ